MTVKTIKDRNDGSGQGKLGRRNPFRGYDFGDGTASSSSSFREGWVYHGTGRGVQVTNGAGYSHFILRIRTTDDKFDDQLVAELRKRGVRVEKDSPTYDHRNFTVELRGSGDRRFYEITSPSVPEPCVFVTTITMDLIGKVYLQAKELAQKKGADSEGLATELFTGRLNQKVQNYDDSHPEEVETAIRKMARDYVANPGMLNKPLVSFLEAGYLADSAVGAEAVHGSLRECVRRQVWLEFKGASLTVMDFSRIFHRICDAMGIPPITD